MPSTTPDKAAALLDTVRTLGAAGFAHALMGGVAVGLHAQTPRATEGTDLAVTSTIDRRAVKHVMVQAGFQWVGDFPHTMNFRHAGGEPVQLAMDQGFDAMIARSLTFDVAGTLVSVVNREDLIAMKLRAAQDPARRASKRLRDQADVELLRGDVDGPDHGW